MAKSKRSFNFLRKTSKSKTNKSGPTPTPPAQAIPPRNSLLHESDHDFQDRKTMTYLEVKDAEDDFKEDDDSGITPQDLNEGVDYSKEKNAYGKFRSIFLLSSHPRIHRTLFRSLTGVSQERARHLSSYPWVIHPYSDFRWVWDIILCIFLAVALIINPVLLTFYSSHRKEVGFLVTICILSGLFTLDIVVNFRTGYTNAESNLVILDSRSVAWHYFRTWFAIDLISTIPYDPCYVLIAKVFHLPAPLQKSDNIILYLRLLELLKVFRIVRVIRYLTRFQEAYQIDSMYIRVINLHIVIFFALHWISCLHYLIADLFNHDPPKADSWVTLLNLWNQPVWRKYINCVIRGLSNMACLGYGSSVPKEPEDILCTIFSIMIGATCFALFIGNLSSILISVDVAQRKYAEVLNQVTEYMKFKQIPKELQQRVVMYYEHRYRRKYFNEYNILNSLSDVMRQELQMFNCRRLVQDVPIFHGLPVTIVQNIVARLQFEVYLPKDVIIGAHTIGDCMYFIEQGAVSIVAPNGKTVSYLRDGDFFGELALITNERRNATVVATTFCDMYRLERDDFEEAIAGYPEVYGQIVEYAERRAARTIGVADMESLHPRTQPGEDISMSEEKSSWTLPDRGKNKRKEKRKGGGSLIDEN